MMIVQSLVMPTPIPNTMPLFIVVGDKVFKHETKINDLILNLGHG